MEKKSEVKLGTTQIAVTAALLAICIISQTFKNLSIFITGPIINACICIAVLSCGLICGIILSIITPVTAYLIAASPVMSAVPAIIVFIMLGNIVLAVSVHLLVKPAFTKSGNNIFKPINMLLSVLSAALKGIFMGLTISLWLLPTFIPAESPLRNKMPVFQTTFSLYQFLTACIGFVYVFIIWTAVKKVARNPQ